MFSHERLKSILNGLTIHLVEASLALSSIQQQTLTESPASTPPPNDAPPSSPYQSCRLEAHGGVEVHWYKKLEDVPRGELSRLLKLSEIIPQVFHIFLPTSFWMLCPFISFRYGMFVLSQKVPLPVPRNQMQYDVMIILFFLHRKPPQAGERYWWTLTPLLRDVSDLW